MTIVGCSSVGVREGLIAATFMIQRARSGRNEGKGRERDGELGPFSSLHLRLFLLFDLEIIFGKGTHA